MTIRLRALALAALVAALAPVAIGTSPAGAVDQDLVVSVAAGAPGTEIDVSSASCIEERDVLRFLSVRLISGTAPGEVLAGFGSGDGPTGLTIVVPDWVDPNEPAVIEATCQELDLSGDDFAFGETVYDPVAFDVEPGIDPPVQAATLSRTELLVGQGFAVDGAGCTVPGAAYGLVEVAAGDDRSGRSIEQVVTGGRGDMAPGATDFRTEALFVDGGTAWSASKAGDQPAVIEEVDEIPNSIEPGTYLALPYCTDGAGTFLAFEPQLLQLTGKAPIDQLDLTFDDTSRTATLAGSACTDGDVQGSLEGDDIEAEFADSFANVEGDEKVAERPLSTSAVGEGFAPGAVAAAEAAVSSATPVGDGTRRGEASIASVLEAPDGTSRALADDGYLDEVVTPDGSGAWALADTVGFDVGVVRGYALCGDPLVDGFFYDPQIVAVQAAQVTTPLVPQPTGAEPIRANASYAG